MSATSQVAVTDAASLVAAARDALNRYFAAELGRSFSLPAPAVLERQRQAFVARFGPEALAVLDDAALLRELPPNGQGDLTMDYFAMPSRWSRWARSPVATDTFQAPVGRTRSR